MAKAQSFDAAEYLDSAQAIADYLTEAFQTGDADFILHAIGTVARAEGMAGIAQTAGLNREHLYRALGAGGNPELDTIMKVLGVLGVQLAAAPKPDVAHSRRHQARRRRAAEF
jgi:probable addiction module antidote protein